MHNLRLAARLIYRIRLLHFLLIGASGVFINLTVTFLLTTFVFGVDRFFIAYLIGSFINVTYNFILHTIVTFSTKKRHLKRYVEFIIFSVVSAYIQIITVRYVTHIVGNQWYLLVIASTILVLSIVSFIFFKRYMFNEAREEAD